MGIIELNLPPLRFLQNLSFFDLQSVLLLSILYFLPSSPNSLILFALFKSAQV